MISLEQQLVFDSSNLALVLWEKVFSPSLTLTAIDPLSADEYRPPLYSCVNISNDTGCSRPLRWDPERHLSPPAFMAVPV